MLLHPGTVTGGAVDGVFCRILGQSNPQAIVQGQSEDRTGDSSLEVGIAEKRKGIFADGTPWR